MKLKFELVNGYGVLLDDSIAETGKPYYGYGQKKVYIKKKGVIQAGDTIVFAEKELNLDVPVFEWRDFEPNEKSLLSMFYNVCKATYPEFDEWIEAKEYKKWLEKSNPSKYTEEDIERAFMVGLNCSQEISLKGLPTDEGLDYQYKKLNQLIQSLQKYPKYVVMERESELDAYYRNGIGGASKPKLFKNSEGRQQGTVKELIW